MKKKVALIFGGVSPEHEVSVASAHNIFKAFPKEQFECVLLGISKDGLWYLVEDSFFDLKNQALRGRPIALIPGSQFLRIENDVPIKIDVAFPILHGKNGEDGMIQGVLRAWGVPFVGSDIFGSAICMDKIATKELLAQSGIAVVPHLVAQSINEYSYEEVAQKLGTPFFVKPARTGSSVGVYKVKNEIDFDTALHGAFRHDTKVLIEKYIDGREIQCGILEGKASVLGEVNTKFEFYDFQAKYKDDTDHFLIPSPVSAEIALRITHTAAKAAKLLEVTLLSRVDCFLAKDETIYVNEINTLPGFTEFSMYPRMWGQTGMPYPKLVETLIAHALVKPEI